MSSQRKVTSLLYLSQWRARGMVPKRGEVPRKIERRYGGGQIKFYDATQVRPLRQRSKPVPVVYEVTPENVARACWTATRTAKRYRDAAQKCYERGAYSFATRNRETKELLYDLKDRAIAWLAHHRHIQAVRMQGGFCVWSGLGYTYHSTLGTAEILDNVDDGPLLIEAKAKSGQELRLIDATLLLESLEDFRFELRKVHPPIVAIYEPREYREYRDYREWSPPAQDEIDDAFEEFLRHNNTTPESA